MGRALDLSLKGKLGYLSVHFHPSLVEGCPGVSSPWHFQAALCLGGQAPPRQWRETPKHWGIPQAEKLREAGSEWGVPGTAHYCISLLQVDAELAQETRGRVSKALRVPPATPKLPTQPVLASRLPLSTAKP